MSNNDLLRSVQDSVINNDFHAARQAFNDWQMSNCYYPTYQRVYDAHTKTVRMMLLPCGRCYHCLETKINEWVTRMYAHAEDFKNVYFITLTYRSFSNIDKPVNRLIISKLKEAVWSLDSKNQTHHLSYNPCLLVKSHYQKFLKRLRKNTGISDLSYVLCGEYGSKYGRPHFHMILFTNKQITRADIVRAWSVCLFRKDSGEFICRTNQKKNGIPYDFPIGRISFDDLVANGSFNTTAKIQVDGRFMDVANCFAYVCKYVCKRDNANMSRVKRAYHSLYEKVKLVKVFDNDIQYRFIRDYLQSLGYPFSRIDDLSNNLKKYVYEKNVFSPVSQIFSDDLHPQKETKLYGFSAVVDVYPSTYHEFRDRYEPFCEFSRGLPIGSVYAHRHLQEFKENVFNKPLLQESGFVVPSYFRAKASEQLYGLRQVRSSIKGVSRVFGSLPDLLGRFDLALQMDSLPREYFDSTSVHESIKSALQNDNRLFVDLSTGCKVILHDMCAKFFKYDRHSRSYKQINSVPVHDWIRAMCVSIRDELSRHEAALRLSEEHHQARVMAFDLLNECIDDTRNLRDSFVAQAESERMNKQKIYDDIHKSCE